MSSTTLAVMFGSREVLRERLDARAIGPERLVARLALEQREHGPPRGTAAFDHLQQLAERDQLLEPALEQIAGDLLAVVEHDHPRLGRAPDEERLERALVLDERLLPRALGAEERRLRDEDVAAIDELRICR